MAGKRIIAVSGGIDSMVLLDMAVKKFGHESLIVAHVDHGIRSDSKNDALFVEEAARSYQVPSVVTSLKLGRTVSEEVARAARYEWLHRIRQQHDAVSIQVAHHQDDVIETVFLNLVRGTRWRGLASIRDQGILRRPLLSMNKAEIIDYALSHNLAWRDDSTNEDVRLTRNYIRHLLIPRLTGEQRQAIIALWRSQCTLRDEIEAEVQNLYPMTTQADGISRYWLVMADPEVQYEIVQQWLGRPLQGTTLERVRHFVATARNGSECAVEGDLKLLAKHDRLVVKP